MINASKIHELVQVQDDFSLAWVSVEGEIIRAEHCRCTSFHGEGDTMNILIKSSGEIRTVIRNTIIEFNGQEVVL